MTRIFSAVVLLLAAAATATSAPSIRSGSVTPATWDTTESIAVAWVQSEMTGAGLGPAIVEINTANDGSPTGVWIQIGQVSGPLRNGANGIVGIDVSTLEGRHQVQVRVNGASDSPLLLGTVQLDRTAPVTSRESLTDDRAAGVGTIAFDLEDEGSGVDEFAPVQVEYYDGASWVATPAQPPGSGRKSVQIPTAALSEGSYPVRVDTMDVLVNTATRQLGRLVVDRTSPRVTNVRVTRGPTATNRSVEIAYLVSDPEPSSGFGGATSVALIDIATRRVLANSPAGVGDQRMTALLPFPGVYALGIVATDTAGNVGTSDPVEILVPPPAPPPTKGVTPPGDSRSPITLLRITASGPPQLGPRWVLSAARRVHAKRALTVNARLVTAQTPAAWEALLGTSKASQFDGYTTFDGLIAVGPTATRALNTLRDRHRCVRRCSRISRAAADRMVSALAVVLHESLHASGPFAKDDYLNTESGRAFEEGFTEAATVDLLPDLVAALDLAPAVKKAIAPAVRRYRPHYPAQYAWASDLSKATNAKAAGARAWRISVADTWDADRWTRLAAATGRTEAELRAAAPPLPDLPTR